MAIFDDLFLLRAFVSIVENGRGGPQPEDGPAHAEPAFGLAG